MHDLSRYGITASCILLDREFFSVGVIRAICGYQKEFIMPAVKRAGIKKMILKYHEGTGSQVSEYVMKKGDGTTTRFNLAILPSEKYGDKDADVYSWYLVFTTNIPIDMVLESVEELPEEYKLRWGIETCYHKIEEIRPRTISRNPIYRMILVYTAMFVYNMWMVEKNNAKKRDRMTLFGMALDIADATLAAAVKKPPDPSDPG